MLGLMSCVSWALDDEGDQGSSVLADGADLVEVHDTLLDPDNRLTFWIVAQVDHATGEVMVVQENTNKTRVWSMGVCLKQRFS